MDKDSFGSDLVGRVVLNVKECLVTDLSHICEVPPPQRYRLYVDDVNQKVLLLKCDASALIICILPDVLHLYFSRRFFVKFHLKSSVTRLESFTSVRCWFPRFCRRNSEI
jgi:hypothetical protein